MLRKRLIGLLPVRDGIVVQSYQFSRYLPVGLPEISAEHLDRWGIDEIFIQVIDRSRNSLGPDFAVINAIANCRISTPIVYGGGIRNVTDAVDVIRAGADRVCVDHLLHSDCDEIRKIAHVLGAQAVVGSFPLAMSAKGEPLWYHYPSGSRMPVSSEAMDLLHESTISEALLIDCQNEGKTAAFDFRISSQFEQNDLSVILFGGLNTPELIEKALLNPRVSAGAVGNSLSYQEHAVQKLKSKLATTLLRPPLYHKRVLV